MTVIKKIDFGTTKHGQVANLYTLDNGNMTVRITDFGAAIVAINVMDKQGKLCDIVLGYDTVTAYEEQDIYLGVIAGRYANRIASAKFILNDTEYSLAKNDNDKHHLHGGNIGFSKRLWTGEVQDEILVLTLTSADGDEGYPGNVCVTVKYELTSDNRIIMNYSAVADKDTIINLTNHSYFNLNGHKSGSISNHLLKLNCDRIVQVDADSIPTGEINEVKNTCFDFTTSHKIGERIDDKATELQFGYDHCYIKSSNVDFKEPIATLCGDVSGIILNVYTNKPAVQLYSGNFLKGEVGKEGVVYNKRAGVCLETQFCPDSPNQEFDCCILKAGEKYSYTTELEFI